MAFIKSTATTWTPTLTGQTTAGTTTYSIQSGNYTKIGNLVELTGRIQISAATGTGNAVIGGFPFTFLNETLGTFDIDASGWTWPVGLTQMQLDAQASTKTALITGSGSATAASPLQMTNAAASMYFTITYQTNE